MGRLLGYLAVQPLSAFVVLVWHEFQCSEIFTIPGMPLRQAGALLLK
jgi:hypothetical protein